VVEFSKEKFTFSTTAPSKTMAEDTVEIQALAAEDELVAKLDNNEGLALKAVNTGDMNSKTYVRFCCCNIEERKYVLGLFTLINIFLFADQNLLAPNLTVISEEFNMTEDERDIYLGGYISIGFFAVGGVVAVAVGYLADSVNRKWTFAAVAGELSCMATYWVPANSIDDFWRGLWLTRTLTGIALGGAVPIQFSIFGDFFTPKERGRAVAGLTIAVGVGQGAGQFMAGYLSPDWRTPFLLVSIPAFLLVALYCATTEEPPRGAAEVLTDEHGNKVEVNDTITLEKFKKLISRPSVLMIFAQGIFGILPWGIALVFLNDFLIEEKELTSTQAANVLLTWGLALAASAIFAGWIADKLHDEGKRKLPLIAGITTILAPFPTLFVIRGPNTSAFVYAAVLVPAGFIAGIAGVIMKTLLFGVTIPETRGSAYSLLSLVDEIGKGVGPYLASLIIVGLGNRTDGITVAVLMWIPCGFIHLMMYFTIERDGKAAQLEMLQYHTQNKEEESL